MGTAEEAVQTAEEEPESNNDNSFFIQRTTQRKAVSPVFISDQKSRLDSVRCISLYFTVYVKSRRVPRKKINSFTQ